MAFKEGNTYYSLRTDPGRKLIFKTPEELQAACDEYFQWCQDNPLIEHGVISTKMGIQNIEIPKVRVFTAGGLCMYLGISKQTFENYQNKDAFVETVTRAKEIILNQKFENAACGLLNPQFIGKDIGLIDKQDVDHKNNGGTFTGETKVTFHKFKKEDEKEGE